MRRTMIITICDYSSGARSATVKVHGGDDHLVIDADVTMVELPCRDGRTVPGIAISLALKGDARKTAPAKKSGRAR